MYLYQYLRYIEKVSYPALNFGLCPDFSVQIKVSLSKSLSERLS